MKRLLVLLTLICAGVAFAQTGTDSGGYSGPAVLSSAGRPLGRYIGQPIDFQFHAGTSANYYTGLSQPTTDQAGDLTKANSWGVTGTVGAYGARHGSRDTLSLDFSAGYRAHAGEDTRRYNGANFRGGLNYSRQVSVKTSVQTTIGAYSSNNTNGGVYRSIADESFSDIAPLAIDGFDSRTTAIQGSAGMTYMLSQRWAATASGGVSYIERRSNALFDSRGWNAQGNLRRLLSSTSSVGVSYGFSHFLYPGGNGESWIQNTSLTFSKQFAERWSFTSGFGAYRVETERIQSVALDPILAAIVGQATTLEPFHSISYGPSIQATLSRTMQRGSVSLYYSRGITPGNAYFTTSERDNVGLSTGYTVSNRASIGGGVDYFRQKALAQGDIVSSHYGAQFGFSYRLSGVLHFTAGTSYYIQRVDGSNFDRNRLNASVGLTFSPGGRPLSLF